ncbi:hypothetical protein ACTFIY_010483 [Dictyostelium cf. discoideum]
MLPESFNSLSSFFSNIFSLFFNSLASFFSNIFSLDSINFSMTVWDVGGQHKIRALWKHYYQGSNAIIFVIDSTDRERIDEVKEEIDNLLFQDELKGIQILIFANKQDINNAMNTSEIVNSLNLNSIKDRKWCVQPCSAIRSDGIYEGLDWVENSLNNK